MRFRVKFTQEAAQDFLSLPTGMKSTIQKAIQQRLETEPLCYGKPLRYSWKGHRSLRVSNYRVIYRVEAELITVVVVKIDIRRDVYE